MQAGSPDRVERRLAAILAADVAGYSRLMDQDEAGTLSRMRELRQKLIDPTVAERKGRIVKTTGDGILIEFPSVVEAVACAVAVQRGMIERNASVPEDQRIEFRVGINTGDIIVEDGDIHGAGVNVASRLETLSEPGGICVSALVYDQVHGRIDCDFDDLGEQSLKNIARPVRAYRVRFDYTDGTPRARASARSSSSTRPPITAPRLSIVVLPFANLSNDPEQQYFADGITEDVTTDLSRIEDMFVISRNTAFTYRNKPADTKQIGRELGVRYVLEGSVRRSGAQVRVTAQLIDAETDTHLWADRFEGDTVDLFALQNEITSRISIALGRRLIGAEAARPTEHPDALDYILRARAAWSRPPARHSYAEAVSLFERALALDPGSVAAKSLLANALAARAVDRMTDSVEADIARAEALVEQALTEAPHRAQVHFTKGQVLRAQGRFQEAIPEYEAAIALDRNSMHAIGLVGVCKLLTGSIEEAIPLMEQAARLSPRDPFVWLWHFGVGRAHLLQSRIEEALPLLERARIANPGSGVPLAYLAAVHALQGETRRAAAELADARRLTNDGRFESIARLRTFGEIRFAVPKIRALFEATYFVGLREAGMPEE